MRSLVLITISYHNGFKDPPLLPLQKFIHKTHAKEQPFLKERVMKKARPSANVREKYYKEAAPGRK